MGGSQSRQRASEQRTGATQTVPSTNAPPARTGPPLPQYYGQNPYHQQPGPASSPWRPPYTPQGTYPAPFPNGPAGHLPHPAAAAQELTQTATIRNAVNLKKNTLRAVPLEGDPTKLAISFLFDASAACSVSTFVGAREEPANGCKLATSKQPVAPAVTYEKGLGAQFPRPGDPASRQHIIDFALHSETELADVCDEVYPLVIRLETITDKGLHEGHTLQELVPGEAQKVWVQSQTTFASLVKDEETGGYEVKVLKQKIWVDGVSYELQEIYGMEQASQGGKVDLTEEDSEDRLCVICLVNERDTTVLPCRHMCMCHECAQELRKQTSKCPICRNHVESLLHIKMQKHGGKPEASTVAPANQEEVAKVAAALNAITVV